MPAAMSAATYRATIDVPSIGGVTYSIAYSGGFYALVDATEPGFSPTRDEEPHIAACAHDIVEAIRAGSTFLHYSLGDVGPLPFLHFMGPVEQVADDFCRSRSTTCVHPGVICRSTTGIGTSARLALMHHEGRIGPGDRLETVSLRDTTFIGQLTGTSEAGGHDVVENTITGRSYVFARSEIVVNCNDPMVECSGLRHILRDDST